jgi:hypothetical protein
MLQANSVMDVLNVVKRYSKYREVFYRGQSGKYESTQPGIARNKGLLAHEEEICEEEAVLRQDEFQGLTPIERLAKMQHHRSPTRLIDLTLDPLIGLFFSVRDVESEYSGHLHVYVQPSRSLDDKAVRLLSLLAWLKDRTVQSVQLAYQKEYGEPITERQITTLCEQVVFVRYSENLGELISRLHDQSGTFAICGNKVRNGVIERDLYSLDEVKPTAIIEIPFEYKLAVKQELDQSHGINEATAFSMDLDSTAVYLTEKWWSRDENLGDTYKVADLKNSSVMGVKRVSVYITLTKALRFEQVKQIAATIMDEHRKTNGVVWLYVARNSDDYIMRNWILEGQWIAQGLEDWGASPIAPAEANGYRWRIAKEYLRLAEFHNACLFEEDNELLVCHQKVYETIRAAYFELHESFTTRDFVQFVEAVARLKKTLSDAFVTFNTFGHSRNIQFEDFLGNYSKLALRLDSLSVWTGKAEMSYRLRQKAIRTDLEEAGKYVQVIDGGSGLWANRLGVSEADFARVNPYNRPKREYNYEPTMPIAADALVVEFQVDVRTDNTGFSILAHTNLFESAKLMVSLVDRQGRLVLDWKSEVRNGLVEVGGIPVGLTKPESRPYRVVIMSVLPSLQPEEFLARAGIEYENLAGPYIRRVGLGPAIRFEADLPI